MPRPTIAALQKEVTKLQKAIIAQDKLVERTRTEMFEKVKEFVDEGGDIDSPGAFGFFEGWEDGGTVDGVCPHCGGDSECCSWGQ